MNLQQCIAAANDVDARYMAPICGAIERSERGLGLPHLRWMVQEISNGMSENKAMRWLGYIQGVLVARYDVPLVEMKHASMRAVAS